MYSFSLAKKLQKISKITALTLISPWNIVGIVFSLPIYISLYISIINAKQENKKKYKKAYAYFVYGTSFYGVFSPLFTLPIALSIIYIENPKN